VIFEYDYDLSVLYFYYVYVFFLNFIKVCMGSACCAKVSCNTRKQPNVYFYANGNKVYSFIQIIAEFCYFIWCLL